MELNVGTILIGSLFWQDDAEPHDKKRLKWRQENLSLDRVIDVSVPIRYGRLSGKADKGNQTYTMVFDASLGKEDFGKAKFLPLKSNPINLDDLKEQIRRISQVEGTYDSYFLKGKDPWAVSWLKKLKSK